MFTCMCFGFDLWQSNHQSEILYTGAGATLSALLGKSIEELSQTTGKDATGPMTKNEIVRFYQQAMYEPAVGAIVGMELYTTHRRDAFKNRFIYKFNQQLKQTESAKQANLRMKMPVGWSDEYRRGRIQQGHVVVLKCWLDQEDGQVAFVLKDYRDDPSGKQIRLPREDQVVSYWSFDPMFYFSK